MNRHKIVRTPSQHILHEMVRHQDYNKSRISRETGISRRTLTNLYNGRTLDPSHRIFKKLLSLYCKLFFLESQ